MHRPKQRESLLGRNLPRRLPRKRRPLAAKLLGLQPASGTFPIPLTHLPVIVVVRSTPLPSVRRVGVSVQSALAPLSGLPHQCQREAGEPLLPAGRSSKPKPRLSSAYKRRKLHGKRPKLNPPMCPPHLPHHQSIHLLY